MGADLHRAMVATAPGEKLLIGCRPVRNLTQLRYQAFVCRQLHLFLGKSTKTAATKAALLTSIRTKSFGALPHTPGELTALPRTLAVFKDLTSKGRGGKGRKGRESVLCPGKKKESLRLWFRALVTLRLGFRDNATE